MSLIGINAMSNIRYLTHFQISKYCMGAELLGAAVLGAAVPGTTVVTVAVLPYSAYLFAVQIVI